MTNRLALIHCKAEFIAAERSVGEGLKVAAIGWLAGLMLGYAAIRITSSRFLALPQIDVATIVAVPLVLGAVVLLACRLPARRAMRVDPMQVLRRN